MSPSFRTRPPDTDPSTLRADAVRFWLDGQIVEIFDADPTSTALELLRYGLKRPGTKEGCAEGDCGACTILLGEPGADGQVLWRAVNACILFAPMLDGRAVLTVESLARRGALQPAQQALVDLHGSQCGFCTPGFAMTLHGAHIGALGATGATAADLLAGNLCRCTGYGPILEAAERVRGTGRETSVTGRQLAALSRQADLALDWSDPDSGTRRRWFAPRSSDRLATLLQDHPDARLVAGATDVGLWVTKQHRALDPLVFLGDCAELRRIEETEAGLVLGAAVRYSEALGALDRLHDEIGRLVRRIGAVQVRNAGTLGGNIANGSPIGDTPPALIALGARLVMRQGDHRRTLALETYFLDYGAQDRRPGEFIEAVEIPRPRPATLLRLVKLSKRFDSDISAVCGAFAIEVGPDGRVGRARVAFGGMAGTPRRATACEAALMGRDWSAAACREAALALAHDFDPISDVRGTAAYRKTVAANLVARLFDEQTGVLGPGLLALEAIDA